MLRKVEVEYAISDLEDDSDDDFFDTLLGPLFRLASRIVHRTLYKFNLKISVDDISNLVRIDVDVGNIKPIAHLARRSAASLEYLCVMSAFGFHGSSYGIIGDNNGNFACYPRLRVLKLRHGSDFDFKPYEHPIPPTAVPFPILQVLHLTGCCPFGGDTAFRGNAARLKSLFLKVRPKDIEMLFERGVFTPFSHPKLKCVNIVYISYYGRSKITVFKDYLQQLLRIAPNAAVRELPCVESQSDISVAISVFGNHPNIQVLCLPEVYLPLWDAITLIGSLPLLSHLHCRTSYMVRLPAGVKEKGLPAYMLSTYAPMGKRLRCWHITQISRSVDQAAICVLLLALICSNFDYSIPPEKQFVEFMNEMEKAINLDGYKDHAPRLKHLLCSKWGY
ncbi:hypothetical protein IWW39_006059 [Coemansia spiralis]|uniref:Uncharacterized protein n=1 Tax=Coemansia spiralis TaxID=417178 RepID=A0A9W8G8V9_9FUNG|nr:hypothetical protein IWW39_006059 [Coemansia spiralis]